MKKLRLILSFDCNRKCVGCCNNDWDKSKIPVCRDFSGYDQVLLTGGEPLLKPLLTAITIKEIRKVSTADIFIYTAKTDDPLKLLGLLAISDGVTITLYEQKDLPNFDYFNSFLDGKLTDKSLRLNVFKGINFDAKLFPRWKIKSDIEWVKDCPLPDGEVLMKLSFLY